MLMFLVLVSTGHSTGSSRNGGRGRQSDAVPGITARRLCIRSHFRGEARDSKNAEQILTLHAANR